MTNEELCLRYLTGDMDAANDLIENNMAFIRSVALEYYHGYRTIRIDADDLTQVGSLALLRAAERYDPVRGNQFLTYAGQAVRNAMIDLIRSEYPNVKLASLDGVIDSSTKDQQAVNLNVVRIKNRVSSSCDSDPEHIYLQKEFLEELYGAINALPARRRVWIITRFGFEDGEPRSLAGMARMYRLSESRAKNTEDATLEEIRNKLLN